MINSIVDLKKVLKLCRAEGVKKITLGADTIEFGDKPVRSRAEAIEDEIPDTPQSMDDFIMSTLDQ